MSETTKAPPQVGTFCWNELMAADSKASREFYTSLLGWTTEEMDMGEGGKYIIFKKDGRQVAGMLPMSGPQFDGVPPNWLSYISVDDIDARTAKAVDLGAKICVPPSDIPNVGRFCVITDPTGATFALFQAA